MTQGQLHFGKHYEVSLMLSGPDIKVYHMEYLEESANSDLQVKCGLVQLCYGK